jgi:hypothetical protein
LDFAAELFVEKFGSVSSNVAASEFADHPTLIKRMNAQRLNFLRATIGFISVLPPPRKKADAEINGSLKVGELPGGRRWLPAPNFKLI